MFSSLACYTDHELAPSFPVYPWFGTRPLEPQTQRVQFLPDIGHFVPFEAPEAVVEAIRTVL